MLAYWKFESISLQRRVDCELGPSDIEVGGGELFEPQDRIWLDGGVSSNHLGREGAYDSSQRCRKGGRWHQLGQPRGNSRERPIPANAAADHCRRGPKTRGGNSGLNRRGKAKSMFPPSGAQLQASHQLKPNSLPTSSGPLGEADPAAQALTPYSCKSVNRAMVASE